MPTAGTETRLYNALKSTLETIGAPSSSWLTTPTMPVVDGTPNDAVMVSTGSPELYLQFYSTDPAPSGSGTRQHRARVRFIVWMVATGTPELLALKSDVMRALFASEATFTSSFGQPLWPDSFQYHTEMRAAGNMVGSLIVWIDVEMDHNSP